MTNMTKLLAGAAGLAAFAAAAPVSAHSYGDGSQYNTSPYANAYGYNGYRSYGMVNTSAAAQQCSAAVQQRLYNRRGIGGIIGAVLGANTSGQVLSVTQVHQRGNGMVRVRGLASSGRSAMNGDGPYGVGADGALGYGYNKAADLSFHCDVAPNGAVYNVDINRR